MKKSASKDGFKCLSNVVVVGVGDWPQYKGSCEVDSFVHQGLGEDHWWQWF